MRKKGVQWQCAEIKTDSEQVDLTSLNWQNYTDEIGRDFLLSFCGDFGKFKNAFGGTNLKFEIGEYFGVNFKRDGKILGTFTDQKFTATKNFDGSIGAFQHLEKMQTLNFRNATKITGNLPRNNVNTFYYKFGDSELDILYCNNYNETSKEIFKYCDHVQSFTFDQNGKLTEMKIDGKDYAVDLDTKNQINLAEKTN